MSYLKTPKFRRKQRQRVIEEVEEEKHEKESTTKKILNTFGLLGKNGEIRKSKRKLKNKQASFEQTNEDNAEANDSTVAKPVIEVYEDQNNPDLTKNSINETINLQLLHTTAYTEGVDSKDCSENESQSVYSDTSISYNPLTSDTSAISSLECLYPRAEDGLYQKEMAKDDSLSTIHSLDSKGSIEQIARRSSFRKSKSFSRNNSFTNTIKGIFRKSKSDGKETTADVDRPKLFKPAPRKTSDISLKVEPAASIKKTSSIKKKISSLMSMNEVTDNLSRSVSVRDIQKKIVKSNSGGDWQYGSSFMSLVETDLGVSYQDMSFVDYDALNLCSYKDVKASSRAPSVTSFTRTQSMSVHNVS